MSIFEMLKISTLKLELAIDKLIDVEKKMNKRKKYIKIYLFKNQREMLHSQTKFQHI
jgi:hypothetical protein